MVFTEISALVQSQWHALRGVFDAEGHERRVQLRQEKKQAKQQRKAARRAAREARRAQRKQRRSLLSPTAVGEPTDDEERPESNTSTSSAEQPEAGSGLAWARTAEALTDVAGANDSAGFFKSGDRQATSPEPVAVADVAQAVGAAAQMPVELALEIEAQLEQKQREFYDSLGGYSTVDEEEDELHELLRRASDAKLPPKWTVVGVKKAAQTAEKTTFFNVPEAPEQEEDDDDEQEQAAADAPPAASTGSAKKPRPKSLSRSSEFVETEPEDDEVDLRDSEAFDEADAQDQDLFIAEHECDGLPETAALEVVETNVEAEQDAGIESEEKAAIRTTNNNAESSDSEERELETKQPPMDHLEVLEAAQPLDLESELSEEEEPSESESDEEMEIIEVVEEEVTEVEVDMNGGIAEVVEVVEEVIIHEVEQPEEDMFGQQTSFMPVAQQSSEPGVYAPGSVDEYACSIYESLRAREHRYHVTEDIFAKQEGVRPKMRAVLVDWLVEVHQRFELESQTLFLTVNYIDRYLAQVPVKSQRFQLVGVAALLIASKFEEIYPCDMDDLLYICERSYSKADLVDCERDLLNVYKFNLAVPSVSSFLGYYLEYSEEEDEVIGQLASYFAECSLLDFAFGAKYEPSVIACACLLAAYCYVENQTPALVWNYRLEELTGYAVEAIVPCAQDLWSVLIEPSDLAAIATKYSAKEFGEVAHLPLEDLETLLY